MKTKSNGYLAAAALVALVASAMVISTVWPEQRALGVEQDGEPAAEAALPNHSAIQSNAVVAVDQLSDAFASVAAEASPSVVFVEVEKQLKGSPAGFMSPDGRELPPIFRHFFGPEFGEGEFHDRREGPVQRGSGSGFIISSDGYIVTNHHVAGEADHLRVKLVDGREFAATLVGTDPQTEIALIKVDAIDLPAVELGNSDSLRVGEWVLAIGSPFGLTHSVTSGIVSARGRANVGIVDYADFIQTDAAINPGNSGGPLLDMDGKVVGMNTAIVSRAGGSDGIGFAIPANMVKYIVDQLRDHGTITRGFLGVSIQDLSPELAKWFGIDQNQGVLVAEVAEDTPAERAELKQDDVIIELNGQPIEGSGAFRSRIASTESGKDVELTIIRDGKRIKKTVELGSLPGKTIAKAEPTEESQGKLGLAIQGLTEELADRLGYENSTGVIVAEVVPGSPAERAGIRPGSLITEVNKKKVETPQEFLDAVKSGDRHDTTLLRVREGEGTRYVALESA